MSMRTPLSRVRGLGAARTGTEHFWLERITSVALLPLVVFFIVFIVSVQGTGYAATVAALGNPFVALALLVTIAVSIVHMKIGMQVIIEDYVHGDLLKIACLMLNTFFCTVVGAAAVFALLKIAFGR